MKEKDAQQLEPGDTGLTKYQLESDILCFLLLPYEHMGDDCRG